jgi:hypothetical protein
MALQESLSAVFENGIGEYRSRTVCGYSAKSKAIPNGGFLQSFYKLPITPGILLFRMGI